MTSRMKFSRSSIVIPSCAGLGATSAGSVAFQCSMAVESLAAHWETSHDAEDARTERLLFQEDLHNSADVIEVVRTGVGQG